MADLMAWAAGPEKSGIMKLAKEEEEETRKGA